MDAYDDNNYLYSNCKPASIFLFLELSLKNCRCLIPKCDTESPTFAPDWVLNAIPGTSATSFDNCQRFQNSSSSDDVTGEECPREWFDSSQTVPCEEYVYENRLSIVYDVSTILNTKCSFFHQALKLQALIKHTKMSDVHLINHGIRFC